MTEARKQWIWEWIFVFLHQRFRFPPGSVLIVRMLLHVHCPESLGLIDEWLLVHLRELLPLLSQDLADLRIVHLRVLLGHLSPLTT